MPEETHSGGEKKEGGEKKRGGKEGGVVKVGQSADGWDQARWPKLHVREAALTIRLFSLRVFCFDWHFYYLRSGGICARQSSFWESWVGKFVNWAPAKILPLLC